MEMFKFIVLPMYISDDRNIFLIVLCKILREPIALNYFEEVIQLYGRFMAELPFPQICQFTFIKLNKN